MDHPVGLKVCERDGWARRGYRRTVYEVPDILPNACSRMSRSSVAGNTCFQPRKNKPSSTSAGMAGTNSSNNDPRASSHPRNVIGLTPSQSPSRKISTCTPKRHRAAFSGRMLYEPTHKRIVFKKETHLLLHGHPRHFYVTCDRQRCWWLFNCGAACSR